MKDKFGRDLAVGDFVKGQHTSNHHTVDLIGRIMGLTASGLHAMVAFPSTNGECEHCALQAEGTELVFRAGDSELTQPPAPTPAPTETHDAA